MLYGDPQFSDGGGPVALEAAIVVVQVDPFQRTQHLIENAVCKRPMPREPAVFAPAADDIETLAERFEEPADLCRIILKVGIHGEDDVAASRLETDREGLGLPAVSAEPEGNDLERACRGERLDDLPASIDAAVVHEDHLERAAQERGLPRYALEQLAEGSFPRP